MSFRELSLGLIQTFPNFFFFQSCNYMFLYLFIFKINLLTGGYFTILWWFLPYFNMCPPTLPEPHHLPPSPIPLGCPRAPALSALIHASNLHIETSILPYVKYSPFLKMETQDRQNTNLTHNVSIQRSKATGSRV